MGKNLRLYSVIGLILPSLAFFRILFSFRTCRTTGNRKTLRSFHSLCDTIHRRQRIRQVGVSRGNNDFPIRRVRRLVDPKYRPQTVNTDGWKWTQAAWSSLFPMIVILRCFLHAWLSIRDRAKNLKEQFFDLGSRVWEVYYSEDRRTMGQRLRRLKDWATKHISGTALEKTLDLCAKGKLWGMYYDHLEGHATSNMLDRLMRQQNGFFDRGQHFHGSIRSANLRSRAWAILHNYWTWSPQAVKDNEGTQCPAERLNGKRYAENWLENLLIAASLNGTKALPKKRNN